MRTASAHARLLGAAALMAALACSRPPDLCHLDADCPTGATCQSGTCRNAFTVSLAPAGTTHTNGVVRLTAAVAGLAPAEVEFLVDGARVATAAAPYAYDWDTSGVAEGAHEVRARAAGGVAPVTSEPTTVVVDRTAPKLVARIPAHAEGNVWWRDQIRVAFDEPLAPQSIAGALTLLDGTSAVLPATVGLSPDGDAVVATLSAAPATPATVFATLADGVTDLAGNRIAPQTWSFSLPAWQRVGGDAGLNVAGTSGAESWPGTLAFDAQGAPVVAFTEWDGASATYRLHVKAWDGVAWRLLGSGSLNVNPLGSAGWPRLIAAGGAPLVAWPEYSGQTINVYVKRWDGATWQPLGAALAGGSAGYPALAASATGELFAAWNEDAVNAGRNVVAARWDGRSWISMGVVAGPGAVFSPTIAVGADGAPLVAASFGTYPSTTTVVRRWDGKAWTALGGALNAEAGSYTYYPQLLAASGGPVVAWHEFGASPAPSPVRVARWNGSSWVLLGGFPAGAEGEMAVDVSGRPVVAVSHRLDSYVRRTLAFRWSGSAWDGVGGELVRNDRDNRYRPAVAIDAEGRAWVATGESVLYVLRENR